MLLKKKERTSYNNSHAQLSISDLMSGLVFIFIIIIVIFAIQLDQTNKQKIQALNEHKETSDALEDILKNIQKNFKEEENIQIEVDLENKILHLPTDVLFESGKYTLNEAKGIPIVERLGWLFKKYLDCSDQNQNKNQNKICDGDKLKLETIFIEGHSDDVPLGYKLKLIIGSNLNLSVQRAIHTNNEMKDHIQYLKNYQGDYLFSVVGYGEKRPLTKKPINFKNLPFKKQEEYHKKNRRIDLRFLVGIPKILRN